MKQAATASLTLLLALWASAAAANDWTAVGATGSIANSSLSFTSNAIELGYNGSGSLSGFYTTFNVINTDASDDTPPWTTLTAYYYDVGPYASSMSISATLYQFDPANAASTSICSLTSTDGTGSKTCTFNSSTFDFSSYMYYVLVYITRSNTSAQPRLRGLRIN